MNESELRRRFEELTLRPEEFPHREHVRLAWTYLSELPLIDVLRVFPENLKQFATAVGADGLYHETITWAYLILIAERMAASGEGESWERFIAANEDLLDQQLLERYYDRATLQSAEAKRRFVFPRASS